MGNILVLAEHRCGQIRDITFEMLSLGMKIAKETGQEIHAVILTDDKAQAEDLRKKAQKIYLIENENLKNFNADIYQKVLSDIIKKEKPNLTLIGHTASGVDLAPSLAEELEFPLVTDCIGLEFKGENIFAERQMYGGKVNARMCFKKAEGYLATIQQGATAVSEEELSGTIEKVELPSVDNNIRKFIEYIEAAASDVDITQADIVVSIGRGIKEEENLSLVKGLVESIGGVLACSRPIVDAGWLPKDRQVGSSGKTVTPKLYLAIGISGSSQHLTGMKGSSTIIAINKDPNAPIFQVADYGIVDDLFKVIPVLKEKIAELK